MFGNRALSFLDKNYNGIVPDMQLGQDERVLLARINREIVNYIGLLEHAKLRDAIKPIFNISRLGNQLMQSAQPWVLVKSESEPDRVRAGTVIGLCANIICQLSIMLLPYMPVSSGQLQEQLNVVPGEVNHLEPALVCRLQPGHRIGKPKPLFEKIEQSKIDELRKRYAGQQAPPAAPAAVAAAAPTSPQADSLESLTEKVAQQVRKARFVIAIK